MSVRSVARAVAWPFVQLAQAVSAIVEYYWYLFLTTFPLTHAWMHMRHDQTHHKEEKD